MDSVKYIFIIILFITIHIHNKKGKKMKYPKAFIIDGDKYEYYKKEYKNCYQYRHYYIHSYTQEKRYYIKYFKPNNILFSLYQKHLKKEKIYNNIIFID